MKISEKGLALIKSFEGCRLTAYKCPAGVWTIGWGHTGDVTEGQTITQDEADQMLREDMVAYELKVEKYNGTYGWNQNEFDALVSFAYNIGSIDQLTAKGTRSREVIANKILEYNKGGGKVLTGLVRRRKAEQELFLTPVVAPVQQKGKSQKEVREYAIAAKDWIYVWGANGQLYTQKLADKLFRTYGSATYNREYYQNKLATGKGMMAADCSGFMHPLSGYDNTADGYYRKCGQKGTIASLPKDKVCLVFKARSNGTMHHIGIYLGDGTVAEMASSQQNYQHRNLGATNWSHWGMPKWIDYTKLLPQEPGWIQCGDRWQYLKSDGTYMRNGWMLINHHWYLFDQNGWMLTGWQQKDGKMFYLEESGDYAGACWHETAEHDGSLERWHVE